MASASDSTARGRALRGFAEGALMGAVGVGLVELVAGRGLITRWPYILTAAAAVGLVFAVGRAVARSAAGSGVGATAGSLAGVALGWLIPWTYAYEVHEPDPPGQPQPGEVMEVRGPTLDGEEFDLQRWRGKVVLVDFWATWCGPCLAELPHVREAYDQYHADGFEVVGVSLDRSRAALEAYVQRQKLPWPQIYFDEQGWPGGGSPVARQHKIDYIPATFLLDREGRVVAKGLQGDDLKKEVARQLGKGEARAAPGDRKSFRIVQPGIYVGLAVGLLLGAVGGALVERRLRGPAP